jgi:hypothetical protein
MIANDFIVKYILYNSDAENEEDEKILIWEEFHVDFRKSRVPDVGDYVETWEMPSSILSVISRRWIRTRDNFGRHVVTLEILLVDLGQEGA